MQAATIAATAAATGPDAWRHSGLDDGKRGHRRARRRPAATGHAGLSHEGSGGAALLALLALEVQHRQALPAPLLVEVLQHSHDPSQRGSGLHGRVLCR